MNIHMACPPGGAGLWGRRGQSSGVRWSALGSQAKLSPDAASSGRGPSGPGPLVPLAPRSPAMGFLLFIGTCLVTHALSCVHSAFARQPQKFGSFWVLSIREVYPAGSYQLVL